MISKQWMMQIRKFCALQNPHSMRLVAKKQVSVSHIFANIITGYNPSDLNRYSYRKEKLEIDVAARGSSS